MGNNRVDDKFVETVVYGRIEPRIYAFETGTIPNYLKVGDTFRKVEVRLNEWRARDLFPDLQHIGDWSAIIEAKDAANDTYFRDYSVHKYLIGQGKDRLTSDVFKGQPFSQEFFKQATKEDVENAIKDIVDSYGRVGTDYVYYGLKDRISLETAYKRDSFDWDPRKPLQSDAIKKFKKARKNHQNNLLMYAVMRFGKSFTSLCCAKAMKAKFVLVVSGKADVADEWQKNVQQPGQFKDFVFLNSKKLKKNDKAISDAQRDGKCIVLFLTLQDLSKEKKRFEELFRSKIDLMIIDETHFGARAETLGKVIADAHYQQDTYLEKVEKSDGIKDQSLGSVSPDDAEKELEKSIQGLNVQVKLHLSGTPYRILMGSEFKKEDVISFCQYSDIIREKEKWYLKNIAGGNQEKTGKEEWDNPYYGFPQMVRFAFNLNESSLNRIKELQEQGYTYHLSALFAPQSIEKDEEGNYRKFVYETEALDFLHAIDGTKCDKNILSFLDNQRIQEGQLCHHIVMVLPYCASCDAMEKLIKSHSSSFSHLGEYEIINISGIDCKYKTIQEVKSEISHCESEGRKTITLTVNRMLTGCTVPEWDTMIFLKDTASPQDYDQAIFRLQSQFVAEYEGTEIVDGIEVKRTIKKDMKPQTLLIDFNPLRMFYLQETKSRINNMNTVDGGNEESTQRIARDLEVSPIIHISENKLVPVTPTDILKAVSEYSVNRGITEAANDILVDETLINYDRIKAVIDKEFEISSGKGLAEQAHTGDNDTDLDDDDVHTAGEDKNDQKNNGDQKDEKESKQQTEEVTDVKVFVNKCRSYYRRILFYAFLCESEREIKNLAELIESIDIKENRRIFENLGMNKDFLTFMKEKMSGSALRSLDDKIFDLYRLSHEYEDEDADPIKRATTAIQRFGKISDSEVVTPQDKAKIMVDLIPEAAFVKVFENDDTKFLDIASKMGEFAIAICKRAESLGIAKERIRSSICSIPTSKLAYEFTRFVYQALGLDTCCISCEFTSYDLLQMKAVVQRGKHKGELSDEIDYERIAAILTQKKPFNEIELSDTVVEGDEKMQFSIAIGNPPYQKEAPGTSTSDKPIFHLFMDAAFSIAPIVELIVPARFLSNAGATPKEWNEKMLKDEHFKVLKYEANSQNVFPVAIPGGIVITYRDDNQIFGALGNFVAFSELSTISEKVRKKETESLNSIMYSQNRFNLGTLYHDFPNMESLIGSNGKDKRFRQIVMERFPNIFVEHGNDDCYRVLGKIKKQREYRFIKKKYVEKECWINKYKVFIPFSNGASGTLGEKAARLISKPVIGYPGDCITQTFITVGCFDTEDEALHLLKYVKTKFARILLGILKVTQGNKAETWEYVPMQDFTHNSDIDWTKSIFEIDQQLYAKYDLTPVEIAFIESKVEPME